MTLSTSESCSVVSDSLRPHGLYSPWNSLGQDTGVGSLSLLQRIFPTQESNQCLLHCRQILHQLSYQGSPVKHKGGSKITYPTCTTINDLEYFLPESCIVCVYIHVLDRLCISSISASVCLDRFPGGDMFLSCTSIPTREWGSEDRPHCSSYRITSS